MRIASVVLLFFLGVGAIAGGLMLINGPSGALLWLPLELLKNAPFNTYLIPGIILLVMNGLFSFLVAVLLLKKLKWGRMLLILQGAILFTWITVQIVMIRDFYLPLHGTYYLLALILVFFGFRLTYNQQSS